ncbi:hypothetical protein YT1_0329 [Rhodococcus ruber]|nr:hypothetical protein YT1_0329 [Rhodococcus ruber]
MPSTNDQLHPGRNSDDGLVDRPSTHRGPSGRRGHRFEVDHDTRMPASIIVCAMRRCFDEVGLPVPEAADRVVSPRCVHSSAAKAFGMEPGRRIVFAPGHGRQCPCPLPPPGL